MPARSSTRGVSVARLLPSTRPPARRLILCLDGTANSSFTERRKADGMKIIKPTNVLKLARAVQPWDERARREQVVYYDSGVGSLGLYPGVPNRALRASDRLFGGLGAGFEANVEDALHFLSLNHRDHDQVFLFGFSRGAATAQAIARFLDWSGGLPQKHDAYFLPHLFRDFLKSKAEQPVAKSIERINVTTRKRKTKRPDMSPFRKVPITFLGLWDTVMALGSRIEAVGETTTDPKNGFYRTPQPPACVQHARHAIAIDEQRFDFRPEVWQGHHPHQSLKQRWFSGVHSNVGGSYPKDGLANISFQWMLKEAGDLGLRVSESFVQYYRPFANAAMYDSHKWYYKIFDTLRLRSGKGRRQLVGIPGTANLGLDKSVIDRMTWKEGDGQPTQMTRVYRPKNVLYHLACQPDLPAYLASLGVPEAQIKTFLIDVGEAVAAHIHDCASHGAPKSRIEATTPSTVAARQLRA